MRFATPKPAKRSRSSSDPKRFDLDDPQQYDMFRRLFVGRFVQSLQAVGLDQEDACQEMILGLLRKNASPRSRWDPSRGALSTWMYVAMRGLTLNMIQAAQRAQAKAGPGEEADAATWARWEDADPTDALYLAEIEAVRRRAPTPPAQPAPRQQRLFGH